MHSGSARPAAETEKRLTYLPQDIKINTELPSSKRFWNTLVSRTFLRRKITKERIWIIHRLNIFSGRHYLLECLLVKARHISVVQQYWTVIFVDSKDADARQTVPVTWK